MQKKKSLGQNFLTSKHYLSLIADTADIKAGERVLEVGPGEGALTRELLSRGARVTAVEKDRRLIPLLKEKFAKEISDGQLELTEADALLFETEHHFSKIDSYKVAANIPYYITGALLRKFLSEKKLPSRMVLLVQKEVAERIARSTKGSILSLSVKAYGTPKYVKTVPRGAFSPAPEVDSAILSIADISRENFKNQSHEQRFFKLVKAGFAQKRKKLSSNLKSLLSKTPIDLLQQIGISENARAEDVPLQKWLELGAE